MFRVSGKNRQLTSAPGYVDKNTFQRKEVDNPFTMNDRSCQNMAGF